MCLSRCLLQSQFLFRNNCVSQNAILQRPDPRSCGQSQTCDSNANLNDFCSNFDSSCFSPSNSFINRNREFPFDSLPPNYGDSSSCFRLFQNFGNYPKNYFDQQIPSEYSDITKDSYKGNETKKSNICMNTFDDGDVAVDDNYITQIIDELMKTPTKVEHKDCYYEDYNKNQVISTEAKDETNNDIGILSNNACGTLKCEQSKLIRTYEVLQWKDRTLASHIFYSRARQEALKRYRAKRSMRKFGKQIRYKSRKSTADTKKRLKGRFTKAGAEYDYDPKT